MFITGKNAGNYTPNKYAIWNDEDMGMIGKIAYSIIRKVVAKNPLSVFDKFPVNTGDTIEQAVIKLVQSQGYDKNGATTLAPSKNDVLAVQYFNDWEHIVFPATVYYEQLRYVANNLDNRDEIASMIISVLSDSDMHDKYKKLKGLFKFGATVPTGGSNAPFKDLGTISTLADGTVDYKKFLSTVKNTVKGMSFVNDKFNTYGLERATNKDDIYIIAPYSLITDTDVESLSGVFNLSKAEIQNRIIEIDDLQDENGDYIVYVVDQNAILPITREYILRDQENAQGDFWNYFLHVDRMYAISTLFDGAFFKVATKKAA